MAECVKVSRSEIRMGVHSVILTHKKNAPCYFTTSHNILHSGNTEWWRCKVKNPEVGAEGGMMKLVYDVSPPVDDEEALDFNVFGANLLVQGDARQSHWCIEPRILQEHRGWGGTPRWTLCWCLS